MTEQVTQASQLDMVQTMDSCAQEEQLQAYQNMLFIDESTLKKKQKPGKTTTFSPKHGLKHQIRATARNNYSRGSSKIKWQIVKQKVVQSPSNEIVLGSSGAIKYHKTNQTSTLAGRRVKALKTLVSIPTQSENINNNTVANHHSGVAMAALASPRTDISSRSYLGAQTMVLSQRSLAKNHTSAPRDKRRSMPQNTIGAGENGSQ